MNTPQSIFTPQFAALQNQYNQLQEIYNQLNAGKSAAQPTMQGMSIPFVNGLEGAREYLKHMPANSSAAVFDKDEAMFFTLSVDANGAAAPIKVGRFTVEDAPEPVNSTLTKKDLDDFKAEIRAILAGNKKSKGAASETEAQA